MMRAFLAIAGAILLIVALANFPWITGATMAIVLTGFWWHGSRQISTGIRRRLLADAEYQHAALMRGDELTGIFGRYPPQQMPTVTSQFML